MFPIWLNFQRKFCNANKSYAFHTNFMVEVFCELLCVCYDKFPSNNNQSLFPQITTVINHSNNFNILSPKIYVIEIRLNKFPIHHFKTDIRLEPIIATKFIFYYL